MRVKANFSFSDFRTGKVYELEGQWVVSLVGAGYFTEVCDGQGEAEPGTGEDDSEGVHDATGGQDDESDQ